MPPVFGPVSPSPMRLKSWAAASGTAISPSQSASSDTSGPVSRSSITSVRPASPSDPPTSISAAAASASRGVVADHDALAGCEPVGLDHRGAVERSQRGARLGHGGGRERGGRGHAGGLHDVLRERLRALELGRRHRRARTRRCRRGAVRRRGRPRAAPPGRPRPGRRRLRGPARRCPRRRARRTGWHCAIRAMPGLPGAACSSRTEGERASDATSACSRPPEPTTRTITPRPPGRASASGRGAGRRRPATPAAPSAPRPSARSRAPPAAGRRTT